MWFAYIWDVVFPEAAIILLMTCDGMSYESVCLVQSVLSLFEVLVILGYGINVQEPSCCGSE